MQIRWVKTAAGKNMPIDPDPSFKGNIRLDDHDVAFVGKAGAHLDGPRYLSHFATCKARTPAPPPHG